MITDSNKETQTMIKKLFLLTILLMGLFSYSSVGQGAQATMRVSVTVVSGSSVDIEKPDVVSLTPNEKAYLGSINFKGIEEGDAYISNDTKILLRDKSGKQIAMDIESKTRKAQGGTSIQFEGRSADNLMSSVYRGKVTTSVEYF